MKNSLVVILMWLSVVNTWASPTWLNQMIVSQEKKGVLTPETHQGSVFFKHHALVLFYSSTCLHCHEFAPIIKDWAERNDANVLALSFDNQPLPEFHNFLPATTDWVNAAYAGRPISYPALFVVNSQTHALYPVAMGSMQYPELEARMREFIPKIKTYESKGKSA